ncbi:MAG: GNAT family N-acetyltransferase [Pseudomonadota bacterium]
MPIRDISDADLDELLALNQEHVTELSALSRDELARLVRDAFYARRPDDGLAFLLVFDQTADYASPNFLWFRDRHERFVYVDRIVVSPQERGRGFAKALYEDLFAKAEAASHTRICCEVNSDPPNPGSDRFHEAMGFAEAGEARLEDRGKSVRYLERVLSLRNKSAPA